MIGALALSPQAIASLGKPGRVVSPPVEVIDMRDVPRVSSTHPWLKLSDPFEEGSRCTLAWGRREPVVERMGPRGGYVFHVWGDRFVVLTLTEEERAWVLERDATTLDDLADYRRDK